MCFNYDFLPLDSKSFKSIVSLIVTSSVLLYSSSMTFFSLNVTMLAVFIPTFFFVSLTPGMCMTLSMTLGMTIGLRKTFWMMAGELVGVGLVVVLTQIGVATVLLKYPALFIAFKWGGGLYLGYLGVEMWRSRGRLAIQEKTDVDLKVSSGSLVFQGLLTAIANPKGWAFFIALLPPFVNPNLPLVPQLSAFLLIILVLEFICLVLYALGGQTLSHLLRKRDNVRMMNRISGTLMVGVGIWLITG